MQDLIRFQVPCKLEFTKLVENFTEIIAHYLQPKPSDEVISKLRAVMNEVFINIVNHSDTAKENEVVRFQFEIGMKSVCISVYDYGPGFTVNDNVPPYSKNLIGEKKLLREVIDGSVYYSVVDAYSVAFTFEEKEEAALDMLDEFSGLEGHGMGMSIITKLMDSVTYSYVGDGKYDWKLVKNLV